MSDQENRIAEIVCGYLGELATELERVGMQGAAELLDEARIGIRERYLEPARESAGAETA